MDRTLVMNQVYRRLQDDFNRIVSKILTPITDAWDSGIFFYKDEKFFVVFVDEETFLEVEDSPKMMRVAEKTEYYKIETVLLFIEHVDKLIIHPDKEYHQNYLFAQFLLETRGERE